MAYWRKCNQIHGWFINNCANETDDGRSIDIGREELEQLLTETAAVLKDPNSAQELLPPTQGFFLGSEEVDGNYFYELGELKKTLEQELAATKGLEVDWQYRASW